MNGQLDRDKRIFLQWLDSGPGYAHLFIITARGRDSIGTGHFDAPFTGATTAQDPAGLQEEARELAHDFSLFLLESFFPDLQHHPEQCQNLHDRRYRQLLLYAWNGFVWQLKEKGRSRQFNERGYLYRRARQVVSEDDRFSSLTHKQRPFCYRPASITDSTSDIWQSLNDGYTSWPPPELEGHTPPDKEIFSSPFLGRAGLFFYREAGIREPQQPFIAHMPVREMVAYLAAHFPWVNRPRRDDIDDAATAMPTTARSIDDQFEITDSLDSIAALAHQLAAGWSDEECVVFVGRFDEPQLRFTDIAERLGLQDHNQAFRMHKRLCRQIETFCANWPGPPLADLAEEAAYAFVDRLRSIAKNRIGDRKGE